MVGLGRGDHVGCCGIGGVRGMRLRQVRMLRVYVADHRYRPTTQVAQFIRLEMRSNLVLSQVTNLSHLPFASRLLVTLGPTPPRFSYWTVVTGFGKVLVCA